MIRQTAKIQNTKTILVVEDSPVQALALIKLLEREGLNVLSASNGQIGVMMAASFMPDLIIMDVQMPEMDGLEACRHLKSDQKTLGIPIVLFTSHSEADVVRNGLEEGVIDFVPKDAFSDVVILETLRQLDMLPKN